MDAGEGCSVDSLLLYAPKKKGKNVTKSQLKTIISTMELNSDLAGNNIGPNFTKRDRKKCWEMLRLSLNSQGGAIKKTEEWMKCWNDKKLHVRKKARMLMEIGGGTEEGAPEEKLTDLEERILDIIGWTTAAGDINIPEVVTPKIEEIEQMDLSPKAVFQPANDDDNDVDEDVRESSMGELLESESEMPIKLNKVRSLKRKRISTQPIAKAAREVLSAVNDQNDFLRRMAEAVEKNAEASTRIATAVEAQNELLGNLMVMLASRLGSSTNAET